MRLLGGLRKRLYRRLQSGELSPEEEETVRTRLAAIEAEAARKAEENSTGEPRPRTVPGGHVTDVELAAWLSSTLGWQGGDSLLGPIQTLSSFDF